MMKKSLICIVTLASLSNLTGCKNTLLDPTSYTTTKKTYSEQTPKVKAINTAQIDQDLQSIYARDWKEDISKKRTSGDVKPIGFERSPYRSKKQLTVSELLNKGESAKRTGHLSEAASHYHAILKKEPRHSIAHHQLAVLADKRRDFLTAEAHYLAALQQKRDNPDLYSDLGYSYLMQNKLKAAESYLQQALQLRPSHQLALNNLGILYGRAGNYNRALEMFRRTGSEQEANQKLAALIPPDQPLPNQFQHNQQQTQMAHRLPPQYHQQQQQQQQQQPSGEIQKTAGETVQEIRRKMDQAREAAIAKRNGSVQQPHQKRSETAPHKFLPSERTIPLISDRSRQTTLPQNQPQQNNIRQQPSLQQQYAPRDRNVIDPQLQQQMTTGRLPDNRLNDAFRAIEQSNHYRPPQPNQNQSNHRSDRQGYSNSRQQQSMRLLHPERKRLDVNPLDSMQEWKPPVSQYKQPPVTRPSQQQIPARSNSSRSHLSKNSSFLPREFQPAQENRLQTGPPSTQQHPTNISQTERQAAQVGMSGGLGGMLPTGDHQQQSGIQASHRSFPGTDSRIGGLEYAPVQPYTQSPQQRDIQHSHYNQKESHNFEAERLNSAMYWKSPRQRTAEYGHRQQYDMRQSQYGNQQLSQERSTVNQEYNRQSQHLNRQPHPQGNGTLSPQAGQYYGPDQYKKATSNYQGEKSPW